MRVCLENDTSPNVLFTGKPAYRTRWCVWKSLGKAASPGDEVTGSRPDGGDVCG